MDGRVLLRRSSSVALWDLADGSLRAESWDREELLCDRVLPDGRIVIGSNWGMLHIWDPIGGEVFDFEVNDDPIESIAVLPDGRLATAGHESSVRIWSQTAGAGLESELLYSHPDGEIARKLLLLHNGDLLSADVSGNVMWWKADDRQVVRFDEFEDVYAFAELLSGQVVVASRGSVSVINPEQKRISTTIKTETRATQLPFHLITDLSLAAPMAKSSSGIYVMGHANA